MKLERNRIYFVEEGDTLSSIAQNFGVNPTYILLANNITPKMISKGMILYI